MGNMASKIVSKLTGKNGKKKVAKVYPGLYRNLLRRGQLRRTQIGRRDKS